MVRLFLAPSNPSFSHIPITYGLWGFPDKKSRLYMNSALRRGTAIDLPVVKNIEESDAILVPYEYFDVIKDVEYMRNVYSLSVSHSKKIIFYDSTDYTDRTVTDDRLAVVFRVADYRSRRSKNTIIMPYFSEDLKIGRIVQNRSKMLVPTIGFCGWASYSSTTQFVKGIVKNIVPLMEGYLINKKSFARVQGVILRKMILEKLSASGKVIVNSIYRRSFSSHASTIETDPIKAREQFVENIIDNDIALSVRGDSNASIRFYEILSLGRVPLLVDTDCVLPMEDKIDYKTFVFRIPIEKIDNLPDIINDSWSKVDSNKFEDMQIMARSNYDMYLNPESYFNYIFHGDYLDKYL